MVTPTLRLVIDKGPRKGEILECRPGTLTRIGRVVRGNTYGIKDPGVSQSHIAFEFLPDCSRWAVTDLDTSNGTLLNDRPLAPSIPHPLSHEDNIKIGQSTSLYVVVHLPEEPPPPEEKRAPPLPPRSRRASSKKSAILEEKAVPVSTRGKRTRASAKKIEILESVAEEDEEEKEVVTLRTGARRTRTSSKIEGILETVAEDVGVVEAPKRGRGKAKKVAMRESCARVAEEGEEGMEEQKERVLEDVDVARMSNLEVGTDNGGAGSDGDDMEKMTLGEWFDRMEKYLPMAINDVAEEIIASLREKAQMFDEYLANDSKNSK